MQRSKFLRLISLCTFTLATAFSNSEASAPLLESSTVGSALSNGQQPNRFPGGDSGRSRGNGRGTPAPVVDPNAPGIRRGVDIINLLSPSSVEAGHPVEISWNLDLRATGPETTFHWGTASENLDQNGSVEERDGRYVVELTAPESGTIYFQIRATADGFKDATALQTIDVHALVLHAPALNSLTKESVTGNANGSAVTLMGNAQMLAWTSVVERTSSLGIFLDGVNVASLNVQFDGHFEHNVPIPGNPNQATVVIRKNDGSGPNLAKIVLSKQGTDGYKVTELDAVYAPPSPMELGLTSPTVGDHGVIVGTPDKFWVSGSVYTEDGKPRSRKFHVYMDGAYFTEQGAGASFLMLVTVPVGRTSATLKFRATNDGADRPALLTLVFTKSGNHYLLDSAEGPPQVTPPGPDPVATFSDDTPTFQKTVTGLNISGTVENAAGRRFFAYVQHTDPSVEGQSKVGIFLDSDGNFDQYVSLIPKAGLQTVTVRQSDTGPVLATHEVTYEEIEVIYSGGGSTAPVDPGAEPDDEPAVTILAPLAGFESFGGFMQAIRIEGIAKNVERLRFYVDDQDKGTAHVCRVLETFQKTIFVSAVGDEPQTIEVWETSGFASNPDNPDVTGSLLATIVVATNVSGNMVVNVVRDASTGNTETPIVANPCAGDSTPRVLLDTPVVGTISENNWIRFEGVGCGVRALELYSGGYPTARLHMDEEGRFSQDVRFNIFPGMSQSLKIRESFHSPILQRLTVKADNSGSGLEVLEGVTPPSTPEVIWAGTQAADLEEQRHIFLGVFEDDQGVIGGSDQAVHPYVDMQVVSDFSIDLEGYFFMFPAPKRMQMIISDGTGCKDPTTTEIERPSLTFNFSSVRLFEGVNYIEIRALSDAFGVDAQRVPPLRIRLVKESRTFPPMPTGTLADLPPLESSPWPLCNGDNYGKKIVQATLLPPEGYEPGQVIPRSDTDPSSKMVTVHGEVGPSDEEVFLYVKGDDLGDPVNLLFDPSRNRREHLSDQERSYPLTTNSGFDQEIELYPGYNTIEIRTKDSDRPSATLAIRSGRHQPGGVIPCERINCGRSIINGRPIIIDFLPESIIVASAFRYVPPEEYLPVWMELQAVITNDTSDAEEQEEQEERARELEQLLDDGPLNHSPAQIQLWKEAIAASSTEELATIAARAELKGELNKLVEVVFPEERVIDTLTPAQHEELTALIKDEPVNHTTAQIQLWKEAIAEFTNARFAAAVVTNWKTINMPGQNGVDDVIAAAVDGVINEVTPPVTEDEPLHLDSLNLYDFDNNQNTVFAVETDLNGEPEIGPSLLDKIVNAFYWTPFGENLEMLAYLGVRKFDDPTVPVNIRPDAEQITAEQAAEVVDYAAFAAEGYRDPLPPQTGVPGEPFEFDEFPVWLGDELLERTHVHTEDNGYQFSLFENPDDPNGKVVGVFRGTDMQRGVWAGIIDWAANISQGVNQIPLLTPGQYRLAVEEALHWKEVYGDRLEFVGHSLGSGLATAAGLAAGVPTTGFNGAGVAPITLQYIEDEVGFNPLRNSDLIRNFNNVGDALSDANLEQSSQTIGLGAHQIGSVTWIPVADNGNAISLHQIPVVVSTLQEMAEDGGFTLPPITFPDDETP